MAVIEVPAALVAEGLVFMSAPDWEAMWTEIRRLPGVDVLRGLEVRVHCMDAPVIEVGPPDPDPDESDNTL